MIRIERRLRAPLVAGVLAVTSCLLVSYSALRDRTSAIDEAHRSNLNSARIIASQVEQSVRAIDIVADDIIARIPKEAMASLDSLRQAVANPAFHGMLEGRRDRLQDAEVITVVGRDGNSIVTTRAWPTPPMNSSNGPHFQHVQNNPGSGLHISSTILNKVTGVGTVYFSRRIDTPYGEFLGYVTIGVKPSFHERFNTNVSQIPGAFIRLVSKDGYVISGTIDGDNSIISRQIPKDSDWYKVVEAGGGMIRVVGVFSDIARLMAVQPIQKYPLAISVGVKESSILEGWREQAIPRAAAQLALATFISGLIFFLYLLYAKSQDAKSELALRTRDLETSYKRLNILLSNMTHGVAMFDENRKLLVMSKRCYELYGFDPQVIKPGMSWDELKGRISRTIAPIANQTEETPDKDYYLDPPSLLSYVIQMTPNNRHIAVTRAMTPGGGWISVHEDVTERELSTRRIERLARYDTLTGLANRARFIEHMKDLFDRGEQRPLFALLLLDLDEFKAVNDSFGHPTGDQLLNFFADRLRAFAPNDLIARVGGDEFVILRDLQEGEQASIPAFIEGLLASVRKPYVINDREIKIGLSIGAAFATPDVQASDEILRQADLALYKAKQDGRNCFRIFDDAMELEIQLRRDLARDLDMALLAGEVMVYFQPIIDARTQDVRAMEALCRWQHPTRGFIPPNLFIPIAEEAGLIGALGQYVMTQACRVAMTWPEAVHISVNVSPIQLAQPDFLRSVTSALESSGLSARRLELEITESVLLDHDTRNLDLLRSLNDLGIGISLDDFGTGYSSLSYLDRFAFDKIKIDRSFVMRLGDSSGISTIISAITLIAKAYNAKTTAEGVETHEQAQLLRLAGVDNFQGYLFGAPNPAESWVFSDGKVTLKSSKLLSA